MCIEWFDRYIHTKLYVCSKGEFNPSKSGRLWMYEVMMDFSLINLDVKTYSVNTFTLTENNNNKKELLEF